MRWCFALLLVLLPPAASAQGWVEFPTRPGLFVSPSQIERVRTSITVRVTDRVARVEVEEWFRNGDAAIGEGDYIYPLPGEAVFSDFSLYQGEEELKGETMDAARARSVYEEIVRRRRDPALIELTGHGLVRARVFPFGPGETRNVRLRYTQLLDRSGNAVRFRYATGRRRTSGARAETHAHAPVTFTLVSENGSRFGEPFSPTDELRVSRDGGRLTVRPVLPLTGDFDVFLPLAGDAVGISLATHRVAGDSGFFMLTLSPGEVAAASSTPRDLAVIVDTSGSMSGEKIEQARQALHALLDSLAPNDRFRLVAFSNRVSTQAPEWTTASRAALSAARTWVSELSAEGGTNIAGGLTEAFKTPGVQGRLHQVIFITDGLPTVGEEDPDRLAAQVESGRGEARIFTFGVGDDVHTQLLERMAQAGRGTVDYVEPGRSVEEAVSSLAVRLRHPVLVDLRLTGSPVRLTDFQPATLPDVYAGREMVVFGRYDVNGIVTGDLSVSGTREGRPERFSTRVDFPVHDASGSYIPRLWAARKIGDMMRTIRLEGSTPERVAEVRELALRYGILSEYTSYLVQEPAANPLLARATAPALLPRGTVTLTGASAVASARIASFRRQAQSLTEVRAADLQMAGRLKAVSDFDTRIVAGRTFRKVAAVWTDAQHQAGIAVVDVEPYSRAYFDLLASLPELKGVWSELEPVLVAGRRTSLRVTTGGATTLAPNRLAAIVGDFRRP